MMDCRSIHPPMKTIEMPKAIKKQHKGVEQRQGGIIPLVAVVLLALLVIGGVAIDMLDSNWSSQNFEPLPTVSLAPLPMSWLLQTRKRLRT